MSNTITCVSNCMKKGLGEMLLSLNNISEAKSCVEKILKLQPENDKALSDLGWIYLKQKEFKQAIQNIERALAIKDNYFHTYRLGRAFWEQGIARKFEKC